MKKMAKLLLKLDKTHHAHGKETFSSFINWLMVPNLLLYEDSLVYYLLLLLRFCPPLSLSPPMCSFCFVSLAECVITPNLMCYFAWWYYGPKLIKPWYLGTSSTLLCVFCNKASNLLKVWHGWHGFCLYFNLLSHIQINIPWHTGTNRLTYTHILTHLLRA